MLKFSANISTLFQEHPLLERFALAREHGFDAVEVWFPYELPADKFADALRTNGLRCVGMNTAAGDVRGGDWGLAADPRRVAEFQESVVVAMDYARQIDCPHVHVMAGLVDPAADRQEAWDTYRSNIRKAIEVARSCGRKVLIEPLNVVDRPRYLLQRQEQAIGLVQELGGECLGIMVDLFHLQRGEGNLIERMRASLPYAAHIQFADVPGRHQPGTGEIRFDAVFAALEDAGWKGWIGCEYFPTESTLDSLSWLSDLRAARPAHAETA